MPLIEIDIDPVLLQLGPFALRWYSLMIMAGLVAGTTTAAFLATRRGLDAEHVYSAVSWVVVGGIIGARLTHVVDRWDLYRQNPIGILAIYQGGIAIWGGMIAGGLVVWGYTRWRSIPFWSFADVVTHAAILGQGIGRIGCIVNGDVAGKPTGGDWGFVYVNPGALLPRASYFNVPTHPYPLYELICDFVIFGLMFVLARRVRIDGVVFLACTALYSLVRLTLTVVREEEAWWLGLQQAQWMSIGMIGVALVLVVRRLGSSHAGVFSKRDPANVNTVGSQVP